MEYKLYHEQQHFIKMDLIRKWLQVLAFLTLGVLTGTSLSTNMCNNKQVLVTNEELTKSCGLQHPQNIMEPRIIGGFDAVPGQFPFAVHLILGPSFCGGSIISNKYIITAAHCFFYDHVLIEEEFIQVHVGDHFFEPNNTNDCSIEYKVKKIYPHPLFDNNYSYDIGIIELQEPINFGYYDKGYGSSGPICLRKMEAMATEQSIFMSLAGWGVIDMNLTLPHLLQFDTYKVIDCYSLNLIQIPNHLMESIICTESDTRFKSDSKGDSGSGLFSIVKTPEANIFNLVGIVNRPAKVYDEFHEENSIFAKVGFYKDWIQTITGITTQ